MQLCVNPFRQGLVDALHARDFFYARTFEPGQATEMF